MHVFCAPLGYRIITLCLTLTTCQRCRVVLDVCTVRIGGRGMTNDRSEIDLIKERLDIVDVIGQTIQLTDTGNGQYTGATSAGSKSKKSLNVDRNQQVFNDWASDAQGDVLEWIAYENNLSTDTGFPAILKIAAEMAGVPLNNDNFKFDAEVQNIFTITTAIAEHYHNCLTDKHRKLITETWGITDETIDCLHIGFAPVDENLIKIFDGLFHKDELLKTGFFIKTRDGIKSFYQGRIVFPYWKGGKVVYSIARSTEWTPDNEFEEGRKYKKQLLKKDTRQYVSDVISNKYFYGVDSIKGKDYCIITEGVTDCIMAMQAGEPCISPVTTRFKNDEIETAASLVHGMKNVIICNDNDEAGKRGAIDTADYLDKKGINVRLIELPNSDNETKIDLAEYLKSHTHDDFKTLIKNSTLLIVAKLNNIDVSDEPLDNIQAAKEFIKHNLNGQGASYKTAFIEKHIKEHFSFTSKIITELISETKASMKEKAKQDKINIEYQEYDDTESIPDDIQEAAREIIYTGDPVKKIIETHASMHVGDEPMARALLVSIGIQSVLNSDGIHPKVSGESGKGKTHCCKAMMHLLPEKYKFNTTLSDRAIYYMDIPEGAVVFSDDIDLSDALEGIIKRSTSNFQEGDTYTTLDKNLDVKELYIPPRISWWLTSVDDDQSLQLLNRQFGGGIDESSDQDNAVFDFQKDKLKSGMRGLPENKDVEICRCILDDIKQQLYTVVVPYADDIDWIDKGNRRNFLIFGDILRAFAVLRHRQRYRTEDNELIANIDDYNDAKDLYIGRAKNQGMKLTDAELKFCNLLNGTGEMDYNHLQTAMGVSQGRISQIINGKGKGDSGLVNKVPGLIVEKQSVKMDDSTTVQKNVCSLHNFNPLENYDTVVTLKIGAEDAFLLHYPHITLTLPDKNITPLTHITYITKYILYTREIDGNVLTDNENNKVSVLPPKQGNKVITPQPIPKDEVITPPNTGDKLPSKEVITQRIPETAQKQLIKDLITFKKANYSMTGIVDPDQFTYEFCKLYDKVWKDKASVVLDHVKKLNERSWK